MVFRILPTDSRCVDASIEWQFGVHEYINELLKADCPKGNPNLETRTNPGHDCTSERERGKRFAFLLTFAERQPCHLNRHPTKFIVMVDSKEKI